MNKALFLDRDGVINVEKNYLFKIEQFEFIDGVFETVTFFRKHGFKIIVITNQAGIARGLYSEDDFNILTEWMEDIFNLHGCALDAVYYCPHHPAISGSCDCRKPLPGMLLEAREKFDIDMPESILIGDKKTDLLAGESAGVGLNVLVESGHPISSKDSLFADLTIPSVAHYDSIFAAHLSAKKRRVDV